MGAHLGRRRGDRRTHDHGVPAAISGISGPPGTCGAHVLRVGRLGHHLPPGRTLRRGARPLPLRRCPARSARTGRQGSHSGASDLAVGLHGRDRCPGRRRRPPRRRRPHRGARAGRCPPAGRPVGRASRGEDRHRRGGRRGPLRRGRLHAHRRVGARRGRDQRRRHRRLREHIRVAAGAGHRRRGGHDPGPHRGDGHGRPSRQGPGAAPGRPRLGRVRPGRARRVGHDSRCMAGARLSGAAGPDGGRRRARHRLPVRAGPGHADRPAGGLGARGQARCRHQGARGAGVQPRPGHNRAGQDRHGHPGAHESGTGRRRRHHGSGRP